MFCYTMPMHLREMRMALAIFSGSSSMSTTSAASMAASRAHRAHGDADIRAGEHRRVVDAVADEGQLIPSALAGEQLLDLRHLVGGQQLAVHLVHAQLLRRPVSATRFGCRR